jgi:hypothetical protein
MASTLFQLSGGEAAAQEALDKFIAQKYSATSSSVYEQGRDRKLDPGFMNTIRDERIDDHFKKLAPLGERYNIKNLTGDQYKKYTATQQRSMLRVYTKHVTRKVVNDQMEQLEKQVSMAQGVLGSQDFDFSQFRKGWNEAKEGDRLGLLNRYKGLFKGKVLPRLEAKLVGFHAEFDSSLQTFSQEAQGGPQEGRSVLQENKYIVGDIVGHQKTAQPKHSVVQG